MNDLNEHRRQSLNLRAVLEWLANHKGVDVHVFAIADQRIDCASGVEFQGVIDEVIDGTVESGGVHHVSFVGEGPYKAPLCGIGLSPIDFETASHGGEGTILLEFKSGFSLQISTHASLVAGRD